MQLEGGNGWCGGGARWPWKSCDGGEGEIGGAENVSGDLCMNGGKLEKKALRMEM